MGRRQRNSEILNGYGLGIERNVIEQPLQALDDLEWQAFDPDVWLTFDAQPLLGDWFTVDSTIFFDAQPWDQFDFSVIFSDDSEEPND